MCVSSLLCGLPFGGMGTFWLHESWQNQLDVCEVPDGTFLNAQQDLSSDSSEAHVS
jgi:hypothetical protein